MMMKATMVDHVDSSYIVAALALAFAAAVINGFRQLAGSSTPSERKRRPGQSATAWLLGDAMAARCRFDLPGYRIISELLIPSGKSIEQFPKIGCP